MARRDSMRIERRTEQLARLGWEIATAAKKALQQAAQVVKFKVMDLTPRWKGGLVRMVKTRSEDNGRRQLVYGEGVVFRVHERNSVWSKMPPHQPIKEWVEGKLHVPPGESDEMAFKIQRKIKRRGLTLPNREKRGKMIQRTKELMQRTGFHFQAFGSAMKAMLRRQ